MSALTALIPRPTIVNALWVGAWDESRLRMKAAYIGLLPLLFLSSALAQQRIEIDLTNQTAYLIDRGRVVLQSPVCSGRPGHETPTGTFKITDKDINHSSSFYGFIGNPMTKQIVIPDADRDMAVPPGLEFVNAPMRYYMQFQPAIGMHSGYLPGHPASHGCVRMPQQYATGFFQAVAIGTPVHVYGHPQLGRAYWASPRNQFASSPVRTVAFNQPGFLQRTFAQTGFASRPFGDKEAFKRSREAAYDEFEREWDAKKRALDHEKDALEDRKDRAEGWAKEQLRAQIKQIEQLEDELDIRRDAAKEMLKRRWGGD